VYHLKMIFRNALRHRLRTALTVLGIVVAIVAFGLLRTVVDAWYAGAEAASKSRLVSRNAISLVFPLPLAYAGKIRQIDGVKAVSHANWFGGVYITEKNFFPQFAVHAPTYFDLYPEFVVPPAQLRDFQRDRKGVIVGRRLADTYGFKVGDSVSLRGTIFPGNWEFVVRGIYDGADNKTDVSQFFFQWEYLNEVMRKVAPRRINSVGVYVIGLSAADRAAEVAANVDATFKNSLAETLTETEQAFQLGFVSMTEAIVVAIRIVSYLIIFIIMVVMANTMAMTVRERMSEYLSLIHI
jgi:putative ABC transport system permease protein